MRFPSNLEDEESAGQTGGAVELEIGRFCGRIGDWPHRGRTVAALEAAPGDRFGWKSLILKWSRRPDLNG